MNIWEILHIEPTTDKKAIRRAYAAGTKVIHPEEKPEEFKQLHAAYQAALKYAEFAAKRERDFENIVKDEVGENREDFINDNFEPPTADESSEQENAEHSELLSFFAENQEKQQQRIDTFIRHWQDIKNISDDPEAYIWWEEYLASEDFQNIRWNTQILRLLTEEIDKKFFYRANEVKMLFWKAYGFRENDESRYQGEQQQLWKCLYTAFEYYKNMFLAKEFDRKSKRAFCIFVVIALICGLSIYTMVSLHNHNIRENERQLIAQYMTDQYSGTEFSVPERGGQQNTDSIFYTFHSSDHPGLLITVRIEYRNIDGERVGMVAEEDYGLQLLEYYAAQYGVECGRMEYGPEKRTYSILIYSDIGKIDTFCETVTRMFDEQEELQSITSVGIRAGNVSVPGDMAREGLWVLSSADPQFYDLRTMDAAELASLIRDADMILYDQNTKY